MKSNLAIIIPAYKAAFLRETLASLVAQTDQDFVVYIGDDCSPEDLGNIVDSYKSLMEIIYKRFDENAGGKSLVSQWKRCIELSTEKYIWLFSDDDILPPDAVERFRKFEANHNGEFDICRLPMELINRNGHPMLKLEDYPNHMSSEEYLKKRLSCEILSSASEYIFTRAIYEKYGFVDFPLAWCSDDASWAQMAKEKGLYTIDGLPVQVRMSGDNISSKTDNCALKYDATIKYVDWVSRNFNVENKCLYNYLSIKSREESTLLQRLILIKFGRLSISQKMMLLINLPKIYKLYNKVCKLKL